MTATESPTTRPAKSDRPDPRVIRTKGLTKVYDELVAVDHLDLEVRAGEIFGLLGQNGAGKTTTILMLLGLTQPTSGASRVMGLDPSRGPLEVKRRVGYMPDSVGFYGDMTGRENLRYTSKLNRIPSSAAEPKIQEVLEQVGLADRADSRTDTYSRGMLQRLGIADALVKDPDLLILDEPTTAIDPLGVVEVLDLLRRLAHESGLAILLSSHLLNQVQSVCDRIGIFASGRLIGQGTMADLARRFGDGRAHLEVGYGTDEATERAAIREHLAGVAGVESIADPSDSAAVLTLERGHDRSAVTRAIFALVAERGLPVDAIRPVEPTLEDIYRLAVARPGVADPARIPAASAATTGEPAARTSPKDRPRPVMRARRRPDGNPQRATRPPAKTPAVVPAEAPAVGDSDAAVEPVIIPEERS